MQGVQCEVFKAFKVSPHNAEQSPAITINQLTLTLKIIIITIETMMTMIMIMSMTMTKEDVVVREEQDHPATIFTQPKSLSKKSLSKKSLSKKSLKSHSLKSHSLKSFFYVMTASEQLRATFNAPLYCIGNAIHPLVH